MTPAEASELPERPDTAPLLVDRNDLDPADVDDESGTRLTATWTESDGRPGLQGFGEEACLRW